MDFPATTKFLASPIKLLVVRVRFFHFHLLSFVGAQHIAAINAAIEAPVQGPIARMQTWLAAK